MISDCMCAEHKKMITDMTTDELQKLSSSSLKMIEDLTQLIDGLDDPVYTLAAPVLIEWKGTPIEEIIQNFKKARDNSQKVFDIAQEEIKKRLSTDDVKCLVPNVKGFSTHVHANGTVTRIREIKNDNQ